MAGRQLLPALSKVPRLPGAAARLRLLVGTRLAAPFQWGWNNCALWAADAVHAQLGQDPAAALRGGHHTALQAMRLVRRLGGMPAIATAVLGPPLAQPLRARMGDVGLVDEGKALAVCLGDAWAVPTRHGLGLLPLAAAVQAWRVGHG